MLALIVVELKAVDSFRVFVRVLIALLSLAERVGIRCLAGQEQCDDFPGIILVCDLFLITGEWYWEVVFESGIWNF